MALPIRSDEDETALRDAQAAVQDALLVERVLRGDADAVSELVTRHLRRAFSIAYRILEHREDAEDVVQDSFMRALERIDTLDRDRPFRPWFYRIVVNQSLNFRRSRALRATDTIPEHEPARSASPEQDAERSAVRDRLRAALDALPERQRTIVQLAELEGLSSREIGAVLELSDGTVRWHLHEARRTLRESLQPLMEER